MSNLTTAHLAALGSEIALSELNVPVDGFLKVASAMDKLYTNENRAPVMRKAAAFIADFLDSVEETRGKKASNLMRLMSKSASWHQAYDDYLREAYTPLIEKRAAPLALAGEFAASAPGLAATLAALTALVGAGGWHYLDKQVDEDNIAVEKQKAIQNEYRRLADEIDRKITAKTLRTQ